MNFLKKTIIAIATFTFLFLCMGIGLVHAATYTFTQNSWAGGPTSTTGVHPTNETGWTQYQTSTGLSVSSTIQLGNTSGTIFQTSDTDFNAGTFSTTTTSGTGSAASVKLASTVPAPNRVDYLVGSAPWDLAFDSSTDSMWVTNNGDGTVSKVNVITGATTTYALPSGSSPKGVAYDPVTQSVWVADGTTKISKINVSTGASTTYTGSANFYGAAFDSFTNSVWMADYGANVVSKINIMTGTSTSYSVGASPYGVAFDSVTDSVWVANRSSSTVSKVNILTGTSTAYAVGSLPQGVAFDPVTDSVWVVDFGSAAVSKVNILTGTSTMYSLGANPSGVAFDSFTNSVWVNVTGGMLYKVNITTGTSTTYAVGSNPTDLGVAFDPFTDSVWATNYSGSSVSKVSLSSSRNDYTIGSSPYATAYDPATNSIWVTNYNSQNVSKVNITTGTSTSYGTGGYPHGLAFDPVTNSIWAVDNNNGNVFKLNVLTGASTTISGITNGNQAVFDPISNSVWVVNDGAAGGLYKINVTTNTSTFISIPGNPYPDAFDPITNSVWTATNAGLTKVNVLTGATSTYGLSGAGNGLAFDPNTNFLWSTDGSNGIARVNVLTGTSTLYAVGLSAPQGITYDPTSNSLFVSDSLTGKNIIAKVNDVTGQVIGYFYTGGNPYYMTVETSTNSLWIPNNGSSSVSKISLLSYVSNGMYTSAALNAINQSWNSLLWDNSGGQTLTLKARSASNSSMTGASAWSSCSNIVSGGSLASGGCVNNGDPYIQYQASLSTANSVQSPSLDDITLGYTGTATSGTLLSSPYDTGSANNVMGSFSWNEGTVPASTTLTVALRTASTSALLSSSTWTNLTDSTANCTNASGVVTCTSAALSAGMQSSVGNEWVQYAVKPTTSNANTPTVSSIVTQYIVNAPPQFNLGIGSGTGVAVVELNGTSSSAGLVKFQFSALDPDANTDGSYGGHATSTVTPSYQYSLNGGATWQSMRTFLTPNATSDILMATGTYSPTSTIIWNAAADAGPQYSSNTEVMVSLNDHQFANATTTATTTAFSLDTAAPVIGSLTMDASKGTINYSITDNSNLSYRLSPTSFSSSTPTSTLPFVSVGGNATSVANYSFSFSSTSTPYVYIETEDIYGNDAYQSYAGPLVPTGLAAKDISNRSTGIYGVYLSWATSTASNFKQYDIFRSTGGAFTQIATNLGLASTSYTDYGLSSTTVYYYKIRVEDTIGNISAYTSQMFITPTGNGGGPAISSVSANPNDTNAVVTWNTNILPQSSYVYWSQSSAMSAPVSIVAAAATSGPPYVNTALLTSLTPSTTYYFYVQSTDAQGNTTIDNNGGTYYSFQATNSQPPVISNVQLTPTQNSADIRWTTNKPSNSAVYYGTSSGHETMSASSTVSLSTSPEVVLNNLQASTTYYYYLYSADSLLHAATTTESFFTTSEFAPVISSITNSLVATSTVTITWTTDKSSNSFIYYSTSTSANSFVGISGNSSTTNHSVTLSGLTPVTKYYYYVQSTDAFGNIGTSNNNGIYYYVTTTADTMPPVISNIQTPSLGQTVATVTWTTNKPASSQILYGTSSLSYTSVSSPDQTLLTSHSVSLSLLAPASVYYFEVSSTDQYGNSATSAQQTFTTLTLPGPQISGVTAVPTDFAATVLWTTNTVGDSKVYYGTSTMALNSFASNSSFVASHTISLSGLSPGSTYYFSVQSTDVSNNTTIDNHGGSYYSFTTTANQPPVIGSVLAGNITTASATVTWTTNTAANSVVFIATSTGNVLSATPIINSSLVFGHSMSLGNLMASTTYYYAVRSTDAYSNATTDTNGGSYYSFSTLPATTVISGIAATSTAYSFTVAWTTSALATSYVYYGTSTAAMGTAPVVGNDMMTLSHSVTIPNLVASTTYYFSVKSVDGAGSTVTDTNNGSYYAITTLPGIAISNVTVTPADTIATISWQTAVDSDSFVFYGTATSSLSSSVGSSTLVGGMMPFMHTISLTGLTPSTTYYFYVQSTDASGTILVDTNSGRDYTFTTTYSEPPVISNVNISYLTGDTAGISWVTDKMTDAEVFYGTASGLYGSSTATSTLGTSHQLFLQDLIASSTYYYIVQSTDAIGNVATSSEKTFITAAPVFTNVTTTYIGDSEAEISWDTTMDSTSFVYYFNPTVSGGGFLSAGTSTFVGGAAPFQHSVLISQLTPATTYEYYLESDDAENNWHVDNNYGSYYSFTTTDHLPPVISDIQTLVADQSSAVITWLTDKPSTSQIDWGTASGVYGTSTVEDDSLTTYHAVAITGLTPSSTYYFDVRSKSAAGTESVSGDHSFSTLPPNVVTQVNSYGFDIYPTVTPDTTPPVITAVTATTTPFDAIVNFITDKPALGFVEYGSTTDYGYAAADQNFTKIHTINVQGLVIGTTYHFYVKAIDDAGNVATTTDQTFTTQYLTEASLPASTTFTNAYAFQQEIEKSIASALPSLVPPFLGTPTITNVTENSATVNWTTNINSYSVVYYASDDEYNALATAPYPEQSSDVNRKTTNHSLVLTGLKSNTTYHLMAESFSIPGVFGKSADITFTTPAPKVNVQISKITPNSFRVAWTSDAPTNSVVQYKDIATGITQTITDDTMTTIHGVDVTNLISAHRYIVSVSGVAADGNIVAGDNSVTVATTQDTTPPVIANIKIQTIIDPQTPNVAQAIVGWTTNKPANSIVNYDAGIGSASSSFSHTVKDLTSYVMAHVVIVPNLVPGSIYRVQISSMDDASNTAVYPTQTIVVSQQSQSVLDVILNNFENTFQFLQKVQP